MAVHQAGAGEVDSAADLADLAVAKLGPIRNEMVRLLDDRAAIDAILDKGATKARDLAAPVLRATQEAMGLLA